MLTAVTQARTLLPFPRLRIDTDSGSEFLNAEVLAYCEQEHLTFTRGRPAVKNDQCHVEQKNGAVVRKAVGCARLVGVQAYQQLCEVYRDLRLMVNCFQPSLKLQAKVYQGEQVRRVYDTAQTPLQRLLASGMLSEDRQRDLREWVRQIDPLALSEQLDAFRYALLCGADGGAWPQHDLSWALCTSVPLPAFEEEPTRTGHQEAASSGKEMGHRFLSAQSLRPWRRFFMDSVPFIHPDARSGKHPGQQNASGEVTWSRTFLKQRSRVLTNMPYRLNRFPH